MGTGGLGVSQSVLSGRLGSCEGSYCSWQGMVGFPGILAGAASGFLCGCSTSPQGGHCILRASSSTGFQGPFLLCLALCWV